MIEIRFFLSTNTTQRDDLSACLVPPHAAFRVPSNQLHVTDLSLPASLSTKSPLHNNSARPIYADIAPSRIHARMYIIAHGQNAVAVTV